MKLCFLGTGTAGAKIKPEGTLSPGQRRCCAMLIDRDILVDVSMQSYDYARSLGIDTAAVTDIFLSHTHRDHLSAEALMSFVRGSDHRLRLWCHRGALPSLRLTEEERTLIDIHPVEVGDTWETAGMTVTALAANHIAGVEGEQPLHFIFEREGKRLFYGCDGGWFLARTWSHLMDHGGLDAMILEATVGEKPGNFRIGTHNTVPMLRLLLAAIHENGVLAEGGTLIADHIGSRLNDPEMTALLEALGMIEAYDGLTLTV